MKHDESPLSASPDCRDRRFAIVAARFYPDVADMLVSGALDALRDCNVNRDTISLFDVLGCFELPLACRKLTEDRRFDALVALGAVIRGQTPHFDFVAGECARGIMEVQLASGVPIGFGILTTENAAQAQERADPQRGNKGYAAALAAATMLCFDAALPQARFQPSSKP